MATIDSAAFLLERAEQDGKPVLIVMMGLPASGKSTTARALLERQPLGQVFRLNRDSYRRMGLPKIDYSTVAEEVVTIAQQAAIAPLLDTGVSVIVDDTNLIPKFRSELARTARIMAARYIEVDEFLLVPPDICITRDEQRPEAERVGATVITRMYMDHIHDSEQLQRVQVQAALLDTKDWTPEATDEPS